MDKELGRKTEETLAQATDTAASERQIDAAELKKLQNRLSTFKHLLLNIPIPRPYDLASVRMHAIIREMREEHEFLIALFNLETMTLSGLKSAIQSRCKQRALENNGTSLSFSALSRGGTNMLYLDIVTLLFNPQNGYELLSLLSPHTQRKITVTLDTSLDTSYLKATPRARKEAFKALPLYLIEEPLSETTLILPTEISLSHFVFFEEMLFDIAEIAHLPFLRQIEVYDALEAKYPDLLKAVYSHNHVLRELRQDILTYKHKGITPRVALKQLAKGLSLGGKMIRGEYYAGDSALSAAVKFSAYLDGLDKHLREKVLALKTVGGKTVRAVLVHLDNGECVEIAARDIHQILENDLNKLVLDLMPALEASQLSIIKQKYKNKAGLEGYAEDRMRLPKARQVDAFKAIKIHNSEELVLLLLHFDPTLYELLIGTITLIGDRCNLYTLLRRACVEGLFHPLQKKMLIDALIKHRERFVSHAETLYFLAALGSTQKLKDYFEALPESSRLEVLIERKDGNSLLDVLINRTACLRVVLELLPESSRVKALLKSGRLGQTILHQALHTPESLRVILDLLPETSRLEVLETVLHHALHTPESLRVILDLLPETSALEVLNLIAMLGEAAFLRAIETPEILKVIFEKLSDSERRQALKVKYFDGLSVWELAIDTPESLSTILALLSESSVLEAIKEKNSEGNGPLHVAVETPESLKLFLQKVPESLRLEALKEKNARGDTVLHSALCTLNLSLTRKNLEAIFSILPDSSGFDALNEKDREGDTALEVAILLKETFYALLISLSDREILDMLNALYKTKKLSLLLKGFSGLSLCRFLSVLPLSSQQVTTSYFFMSTQKDISLESVLKLSSLSEIAQTVFNYLKHKSAESTKLLDDYIRAYEGDITIAHDEKLSFLSLRWKAEGLLVISEESYLPCTVL